MLPEHIHLIGIGGTGLSAIARVLRMRGYAVSGSDMHATETTEALTREGIRVTIGHTAQAVHGAELVVMSSAIPATNVEVIAARERGIPVLERREFLGELLAGYRTIAVAGTHGKSTTTGMIVRALQTAGRDPGFIVGGVLQDLGTNASCGSGELFVIEADEYGLMFHGLSPEIAIITTIEMDHPDCFADIDAMREAYIGFARRLQPGGTLVACLDSPQVRELLRSERPHAVTYGSSPDADYVVDGVRSNSLGGVDLCIGHDGGPWVGASLRTPGAHNALNATAAILAATLCGVNRTEAAGALAEFRGVGRRFELKGEAGGVTVIDDYGHHPTEIAATLAAARLRYGKRRLWAVVQPHTFSRLQALWDGFRTCLSDADEVIVTDVYAARSREVHGANDAHALVAAIDHPAARHIPTLAGVETYLLEHLCPGDVLITLGAGDGYLVGEHVLAALKERIS